MNWSLVLSLLIATSIKSLREREREIKERVARKEEGGGRYIECEVILGLLRRGAGNRDHHV